MRENLKNARKAAGMTQQQVAEHLGLSLIGYRQMESGKRIGKIETWDSLDLFSVHQRILRKNFLDAPQRNGAFRSPNTPSLPDTPKVPKHEPLKQKPAQKLSNPCENCSEFTPIGEGDHICGFDPTRMPVSEYVPTEDYFWCNGKYFMSREDV